MSHATVELQAGRATPSNSVLPPSSDGAGAAIAAGSGDLESPAGGRDDAAPAPTAAIQSVLARIHAVRDLEGSAAWATTGVRAARPPLPSAPKPPSVIAMYANIDDYRARTRTGTGSGGGVGGQGLVLPPARRGHVSAQLGLGVSYRGLSVSSAHREEEAARAAALEGARRGRVSSDAWNEDAFDYAILMRPTTVRGGGGGAPAAAAAAAAATTAVQAEAVVAAVRRVGLEALSTRGAAQAGDGSACWLVKVCVCVCVCVWVCVCVCVCVFVWHHTSREVLCV
jgi:hypothetical protein